MITAGIKAEKGVGNWESECSVNSDITYGDGKIHLTILDPTLSTEGDVTP